MRRYNLRPVLTRFDELQCDFCCGMDQREVRHIFAALRGNRYCKHVEYLLYPLSMQNFGAVANSEFRILLQQEFARRVRVNERYSMRAFAKHLGIDSSTLSQILAGKRKLSEKKIKTLCKDIGIPMSSAKKAEPKFSTLDMDAFAAISDWYHFAILDLTLLKSFKSNAEWIARKLGIQSFEAIAAIERLKRLGLLVENNGKLVKAEKLYTNYSEGITSAALKEYQRQVIKKALQAVDGCPQERKDITSITIAADSRKLNQAKEKLKIFRRELCAFLEDGERDSVFHLALQLYPVTDLDN